MACATPACWTHGKSSTREESAQRQVRVSWSKEARHDEARVGPSSWRAAAGELPSGLTSHAAHSGWHTTAMSRRPRREGPYLSARFLRSARAGHRGRPEQMFRFSPHELRPGPTRSRSAGVRAPADDCADGPPHPPRCCRASPQAQAEAISTTCSWRGGGASWEMTILCVGKNCVTCNIANHSKCYSTTVLYIP